MGCQGGVFYLATIVVGRSQSKMLRKSTSRKDKGTHKFFGRNEYIYKENDSVADTLRGAKVTATTIFIATIGKIEEEG